MSRSWLKVESLAITRWSASILFRRRAIGTTWRFSSKASGLSALKLVGLDNHASDLRVRIDFFCLLEIGHGDAGQFGGGGAGGDTPAQGIAEGVSTG